MATSPNYGWLEPDNTDLVKNGALAIRTLGNAIDTTMATMTPKSTFTAKGSIAAATAASTPANLSVGNDGETLLADSSTSTGLRYNPQNALVNPVINGDMSIAQRGSAALTLTAANFVYPVDRWQAVRASGTTGATAQQISSIGLTNFNNAVRIQRTAGNTATNDLSIAQNFETTNSLAYAGKTVTLSFWARVGANYSSPTNVLGVRLYTGTGTDQSGYGYNFTGTASPISVSQTPTTSWVRYALTGTIASTATQLQIFFFYTPSGTAGAADYFDITGVQLDLGTYTAATVPAFRRSGGTIQGELALCQRYFQRINASSTNGVACFGQGIAESTTAVQIPISPVVTPRVAPTVAYISQTGFRLYDLVNAAATTTAMSVVSASYMDNGQFTAKATASGLTQYRIYQLIPPNATAAYIDLSAEL